jgi:23S rRNA (cytosine1962-C5)-methyltransferase
MNLIRQFDSGSHARTTAPIVLTSPSWPDYELIDIGLGRKLERFGKMIVDRPEPQALWRRTAPASTWEAADLMFEAPEGQEDGTWITKRGAPLAWDLRYDNLELQCRATSFRHVGVFPEQAAHWQWISDMIRASKRPPEILNLFGYTGIASLVAAREGAAITHVDASKKAIAWAKDNQAASGLTTAPIRWICDDALKFVERELRRGRQYDAIILDPPTYGRGPKNETWHLFQDLPRLLDLCGKLLSKDPLFVLLSVYALRLSLFSVLELMVDFGERRRSVIEAGELVVVSRHGRRQFASSLFARWTPASISAAGP